MKQTTITPEGLRIRNKALFLAGYPFTLDTVFLTPFALQDDHIRITRLSDNAYYELFKIRKHDFVFNAVYHKKPSEKLPFLFTTLTFDLS